MTPIHLASSVLKSFKKVRGGSMQLNHSELEYKYPTHLVPLANTVEVKKVYVPFALHGKTVTKTVTKR